MDNWFTIVLAFIFFVLPLLEGLKKKNKQPPQTGQAPPPQDTEDWRGDPEMTPIERGDVDSADGSWSGGWGSWPGEDYEDEPAPSPARTWNPDPVKQELPVPVKRAPVPNPVQAGEIGLPEAIRTPESQRLQELANRLNRLAAAEATPAPAGIAPTAPIPGPRPRREAVVRRRVATLFPDRASVRDAIIASEVLGPPVALRPPRDG